MPREKSELFEVSWSVTKLPQVARLLSPCQWTKRRSLSLASHTTEMFTGRSRCLMPRASLARIRLCCGPRIPQFRYRSRSIVDRHTESLLGKGDRKSLRGVCRDEDGLIVSLDSLPDHQQNGVGNLLMVR